MYDKKDVTGQENEIEVTDEMIDAGVEEFLKYDSRISNENDVVENIFRRMLAARK